jgi:hypothetical protein
MHWTQIVLAAALAVYLGAVGIQVMRTTVLCKVF